MSKIWYCPNCGYEVRARGRCHQCRQRLVASALPELEDAGDADEVGYRLEDWSDRDRGRLIAHLNEMEILHRFEGDELVVAAEDESRVDDLTAEVTADAFDASETVEGAGGEVGPAVGSGGLDDGQWVEDALGLLLDAARRLRQDPTDMNADADVAEASTAVFMADDFEDADEDTWAAVGRVTRRLLGALGADEALEGEIREQAGILATLLAPLVDDSSTGEEPAPPEGPETVYELAEWLPEQRAQLGLLLGEAGIAYEWDGDDLVVPADRETEVEAVFERVGTPGGGDDDDEDDGEARYHAIEELFAAADRLVNSPADEQRAADASDRIADAIGPPPIGFDEVFWFRIMTAARSLAETIEGEKGEQAIHDDAAALRDLLRSVV
jgi:hypothetical protein